MATNNFKAFATGGGANRITAAALAAMAELNPGFTAGVAPSDKCNTLWSQSSLMAAAWGEVILAGGLDALDTENAVQIRDKLLAALVTLLTPNLGQPPGSIIQTFAPSTPPGYLLADGAVILRSARPALFTAIGTLYNTGGEDGTQFRLPDARGLFLRSIDGGRGLDAGRALGNAYQDSQNKLHSHDVTYYDPDDTAPVRPAGTGLGGGLTPVVATGTEGGNEARPRNIAVYTFIKY